MTDLLLSQIIAAMAFLLGMVSFQFRARRSILFWMAGSAFANACHFFVLGMPAAGTVFVIMGGRSLAATYTVNRRIMYVFFALILVGFSFTYEHPLDFLALVGSLLGTYAVFQKTHREVRIFYMLCNATWTFHNILAGTPVAALMEATFLTSNLIGYWRFRHAGKAGSARVQDSTEDAGG